MAPPKTVRVEWSRVISPLEDRVLIAIEGASEKTAGGIIIPGNVSEKPNSGKVLAVGPGRRNKKGSVRPLDVRVGDKVIYSQMAGSTITVMNEELLILRENEILGILNN